MKKIIITLFIVGIYNCLFSQEFIDKYNSGVKYFNNEVYDSALIVFNDLLSNKFKGADEIYFLRAYSLSKTGKPDEAIKDYNKHLKINPTDHKAFFYLGNAHYELEQNDEAKIFFTKAIELNPEYLEAIWQLGATNEKLELYDEALSNFNKAIELDSLNVEYYFKRALFYESKLNKINQAGNDYFKVLQLDNNYKTEIVLSQFIGILIRQKYFKEANRFSYVLIETSENNPLGYYYRGITNFLLGKDGCNDLKKAYELGFEKAKDILDEKCI